MKKIFLGLLIVLLVGQVGNYAYSQKSKRKSILAMEKREFDRKLQESLMSIAFSKNILESQAAMTFLLDNPQQSYTPIKNLLFNKDIGDTNLLNIWNIYIYLQDENQKSSLTCQKILELTKLQKSKMEFLFTVVNQNYTPCSQELTPVIESWVESQEAVHYVKGFSLIKNQQIQNLAPLLLEVFHTSTDLLKQELAISALSVLNTENLDIEPLLDSLSLDNSTIRNSIVRFFSSRPQYREKLEKRFTRWFVSEQEKTALIQIMQNYRDPETFRFILEIYPKNTGQMVEMNNFFIKYPLTQRQMLQIINLLPSLNRSNQKLTLLNTVEFLYPQFANDFVVQEILRHRLQDLEDSKDNIHLKPTINKLKNQIKNMKTAY